MLEGSQQMLAVLLKFLLLHWQEPLTDSQMRGSFPFYPVSEAGCGGICLFPSIQVAEAGGYL